MADVFQAYYFALVAVVVVAIAVVVVVVVVVVVAHLCSFRTLLWKVVALPLQILDANKRSKDKSELRRFHRFVFLA